MATLADLALMCMLENGVLWSSQSMSSQARAFTAPRFGVSAGTSNEQLPVEPDAVWAGVPHALGRAELKLPTEIAEFLCSFRVYV